MAARPGRSAAVVALAGVAAIAACGGGADDAAPGPAAPESAVTVPRSVPSTTERQVGVPPSSASSVPTPTTAPLLGLPDRLGIPAAAGLALSGSATFRSSFTVRGVALPEVVAFVTRELAGLGWVASPPGAPAPDQVLLPFAGPDAAGEALVTTGPDGAVEVRIALHGPDGADGAAAGPAQSDQER